MGDVGNADMTDTGHPGGAPAGHFDEGRAREIIGGLAGLQGATLPILHALQEEFGYVDQRAVPLIAEALNLSRAEIHGCVSFYHDFRAAPAGRHVLKICRAEACQARGVEALMAAADSAAGKRVRLASVYCLGLCSAGPAAKVSNGRNGDTLHARLDEAALVALVNAL